MKIQSKAATDQYRQGFDRVFPHRDCPHLTVIWDPSTCYLICASCGKRVKDGRREESCRR
jgi:ribosomal protein S27E